MHGLPPQKKEKRPMIPSATITVQDFAAVDLAAELGAAPAGSSPEAVDQWAAGVAQAAALAKAHKLTGPGTVTFEATGPAGTVLVKARSAAIAQPLETARVAETQAARLAADRAKARKVVHAVPSIVKAAATSAVKAAAVVVKGVSTVVGVKPAPAAPLNAANRPSQSPPQNPVRR